MASNRRQEQQPQPDLDVPGTSAEAAAIEIKTDPGENRRNKSRSTPRSLPEFLIPVTILTGTFFSIPAQVYDRQQEFPMLEPLLASVILGTSVSFWAIFLAMQRNQPAAIEAETVELNEEEFQRMELKKDTLLKIGLIFSLLALLLRVMLQLRWTSLGRLAAMWFAGSMAIAVGLHFYIGFVLPS